MLKAIMAVDDEGGISKLGSMPWPKNSNDLLWFKQNTLHNVVIMGSNTWCDPLMPTPLVDRINVLISSKSPSFYPGADKYISGNLKYNLDKIINNYENLKIWVIGGPNIINQLFDSIEEFYLTRIYGVFNCDKKIDLNQIETKMKLQKKILSDKSCHFEIWKK